MLLLDPDLSKMAPFLAVGLPVLFIWLIVKAFTSEGAAQRRALLGLVLAVVALLLCRPLLMVGIAFLPR
jgi:predicted branched-subunit amino acid permease